MNNQPGSNAYRNQNKIGGILDSCEPTIVSGSIFFGIIMLDYYNLNQDLVAPHLISGIVLTLITLIFCKYNMSALAWATAILPGIFLAVALIAAIRSNKYVIATANALSNAYGTVEYVAENIEDDVVYLTNEASYAVGSTSSSVSDVWNKIFNAQVDAGVDPAKAAVMATAAVGAVPSEGTPAAQNVQVASTSSSNTVAITGEYNYLCMNTRPSTDAVVAEACIKCSRESDKDKCISLLSPSHAICLGSLPSTGIEPDVTSRDACLACTNPSSTMEEQNACRSAAMSAGNQTMAGAVDPYTADQISGAIAGILSSFSEPVAATAQPFTNYKA